MGRIFIVLLWCAACASDPTIEPEGVECNKTSTRTITLADGSKTESRVYFAEDATVSPQDDYMIEMCFSTTAVTPAGPDCPPGATCTKTGANYPGVELCQWSRNSGAFTSSALYIQCGSGSTEWDASGALIRQIETKYALVRIHR